MSKDYFVILCLSILSLPALVCYNQWNSLFGTTFMSLAMSVIFLIIKREKNIPRENRKLEVEPVNSLTPEQHQHPTSVIFLESQ